MTEEEASSDDESVRRRNASLFSEEELELKTVKIVAPEDEEIRRASYSDEDIEKLVRYVKQITTLYDLRDGDWNEDNEDVIREFFFNPYELVLTICFEGNVLRCSLGYPLFPFVDLMYFYREPGEIFDVPTFHDKICFGSVDFKVEGSILHHIQFFFAPIFFKTRNWPESIKADVCAKLHSYLGKLTDQHYKMYGLTILYVPTEADDIDIDVASRDKELVKRLESVVVYWIRQIRLFLQDQEQLSAGDMLCPTDEYEFWYYRYENLSLIQQQVESTGVKNVCTFLNAVQSSYVRQFLLLKEEIATNLKETKSNIEYLRTMVKPCEELRKTKDPADIPEKLQDILNIFRFIWVHSPYYNTTDRIINLFKNLSNQIIIQCTEYINFDLVFGQKRTRQSIAMFQNCIDCCLKYIRIYVLVADVHSQTGPIPWDLNRPAVFNHIDTFMQRCDHMIEICHTMIDFGRHDETEEIKTRKFGGARGEEFEKWCCNAEEMFQESLEDIEEVKHKILDVQDTSWYDEIIKFRTRMKAIEVVIQNIMKGVLTQISNVEDGIEALSSLYYYSKRPLLLHSFEKFIEQLYLLFKKEILDYKEELETEKDEYPAALPYYSGRAWNLHLKKNRLKMLKKLFDDAKWIAPCNLKEEIFQMYNNFIDKLTDTILNIYRKWVDSIGEDVLERLNRPLLCRSTTKPGLLECNIERSILGIIREAQAFQNLGFDVPTNAKGVFEKRFSLRNTYENVVQVVMDYNRILTALSDDERILFRQLIANVEKRITPGLIGLTWSIDVVDEYVAECGAYTGELQDFVDEYKMCCMQLIRICEKICDLAIISLTHTKAFTIYELVKEIDRLTRAGLDKLIDYYHDMIRYIIVIYEGFESNITLMSNAWIKFISEFDMLLEESLKICIRNSMQYMFQQLHGDGTVGPNPLLRLEANLKHNRINFEPSLAEVQYVISEILPGFTRALTGLPRIIDKFNVTDTPIKPFHEVIAEDPECKKLQGMLNNEVAVNVQEMQTYLKIWDPFRDLWEVDKDRFIERYEKENPNAAQFDANIGRYTEVANNVQLQETITNVHFIVVFSADLKTAIIDHCIEWQMKLCKLLHKMTVDKINYIYDYVKMNSELVMRKPKVLEDLALADQLQMRLRMEVPIIEAQFPLIGDQLITLDKYKVDVSDAIRNKAKGIPALWSAYLDTLDDAEKMLGYSKVVRKDMEKTIAECQALRAQNRKIPILPSLL